MALAHLAIVLRRQRRSSDALAARLGPDAWLTSTPSSSARDRPARPRPSPWPGRDGTSSWSSGARSPAPRTCTAAWSTAGCSTSSSPSGGRRRRSSAGSPAGRRWCSPTTRPSPSTSAPRRGAGRPTTAPPRCAPTSTPGWPATPRPPAPRCCARPRSPGCCARRRRRVVGVRTDRPDGDLGGPVVIACDGVNSFLAKEAGLYPDPDPANFTLGVKEVLALPAGRDRPTVRPHRPGAGPTSRSSAEPAASPAAASSTRTSTPSPSAWCCICPAWRRRPSRPEELIAGLKAHPAIAPLVAGGELKEYSAHLIPEGGYDAMPELVGDGLLVAGDAAGLCLAAGIWLEGVNFAIGSGMAAGAVAADGPGAGRHVGRRPGAVPPPGSSRPSCSRPPPAAPGPHFVLCDRVQRRYPELACNIVEWLFTVDNPAPKPGLRPHRCARSCKRAGDQGPRPVAVDAHHRHRGASDDDTSSAGPRSRFEDRMARSSSGSTPGPHITVDGDACRGCTTQACVTACPADLFVPTSDGGILFNYEQCFECGTCYLVCNQAGAPSPGPIPEGGHGVVFHRARDARSIAAAIKWADLRPEVDPITGEASERPAARRRCPTPTPPPSRSPWRWPRAGAAEVLAVTAGPPAADQALREAWPPAQPAWCGSTCPTTHPQPEIADGIAGVVADAGATSCAAGRPVPTGPAGPCRPSSPTGSAPPRRSAWCRSSPASMGELTGVRRLDGGRRELVCDRGSGRASRSRARRLGCAGRRCPVSWPPGRPPSRSRTGRAHRPTAFRPDPGRLPLPAPAPGRAPARRRQPGGAHRALVAPVVTLARAEPEMLDPAAAADRLLDVLRQWGEIE